MFNSHKLKNIKNKILFTYLVAFGKTGGLEKVNRTILKCLSISNRLKVDSWSLYDNDIDSKYFPTSNFRGFANSKVKFVLQLILNSRTWNTIIVGHINLAFAIRIMKMLNPRLKIILIVHGIEVWEILPSSKLWLIQNADRIISVSKFTGDCIVEKHQVLASRISILHNCLDPFFPTEFLKDKPAYLFERYDLPVNTKIVLTVTRINENEGRKGYDLILKSLSSILKKQPEISFHYVLCGKYSIIEFQRLSTMISEYNLTNYVSITGFIKEEELVDHYRLADIYVMPSKKEGFGMVYIEAAACGLQVIAGNADGSAEALMNGKIGHLVNPDNDNEIYDKLLELLQNPISKSKEISDKVYLQYNFETYKERLLNVIEEV